MDPKLYDAAVSGDINFLETTKLDILSQKTGRRSSILHIAVRFQQVEFVKQVIRKYSPLVKEPNSSEDTPLHSAARKGSREIVELLIKTEEDVENRGKEGSLLRMKNTVGNTALHVAVENGKIDVAMKLIETDIELCNFINNDNESPLYIAVEGGFFDIAKFIISEYPFAPYQGTNGMTALHAALIRTHHGREVENQVPDLSLENIRRILRDAFLRIQECVGGFQSEQKDIINVLIEDPQRRTAMISHQDEFGWCPIHYAAHLGHLKATKLLLEKDSSIAYNLNKDNMTPLHLAAKEGNVNIIKELVLFRPDSYDWVDNSKRTALHLAVKHGKTEVVRYMLKDPKLEGIINVRDKDGNTPLHVAAVCDKYDILMMLADDSRVDKRATNKNCMKAIDIIQFNKNIGELIKARLVKKLEKAGGRRSLHLVINDETEQRRDSISNREQQQEGNDTNQDKQQQEGDASIHDQQQMRYKRQENAVAFYCSTAAVFLHFFISIEYNYHLLLRFMRFAAALTYVSILGMVLSFTAGLYVILPDSMSDVIVALGCCFSLFYLLGYI
ncbi:PGG domain [Dillenia turbinata]|uniref:PGG domain n=1 Tax=Dillenia turbinata TaxID=194707 RepID=A0AAN8ZDC0_9MAGN